MSAGALPAPVTSAIPLMFRDMLSSGEFDKKIGDGSVDALSLADDSGSGKSRIFIGKYQKYVP